MPRLGVPTIHRVINNRLVRKMSWESWRNPIGFWFLGLCNNYAYVIMLSAAMDLLDPKFQNEPSKEMKEAASNVTEPFCNPESTGNVLLADILPGLCTKLVAPFFITNTQLRVALVIFLSAFSFLLTAFSTAHWMTYLGIVSASVSGGLGEVTFLAYSAHFDSMMIAFWSSGTGGAGIFGAISYAFFTQFLTPRTTLKVMLVIPCLLAVAFYAVIKKPRRGTETDYDQPEASHPIGSSSTMDLVPGTPSKPSYQATDSAIQPSAETTRSLTMQAWMEDLKSKIKLIKPLCKFMIPLGMVYYLEYFINQGLFEVIYFPGNEIGLDHKQQYRWYQVDYQMGVFISRSSLHLFKIRALWILPLLQGVNVILLLSQALWAWMPSIFIVLVIVLFEGLLGGSSYVNTFYQIRETVSPAAKEFSLSIASLADSLGILLAALTAIPAHQALCDASIYKHN